MLSHEPLAFAGGIIASLSIPWGFSKGDDDLGGYHLVWPRDLVETAGALRLRERLGRLLRRDDATDFVVVPRRNGLARRLHLRQEEIVAAVLAHAALGKEVVHRQGVHGMTAMAISKFVPADLRKLRSSH